MRRVTRWTMAFETAWVARVGSGHAEEVAVGSIEAEPRWMDCTTGGSARQGGEGGEARGCMIFFFEGGPGRREGRHEVGDAGGERARGEARGKSESVSQGV